MMNGSYSIEDLLHVPLRHRGKVFVVVVFVLALAIGVVMCYPRTYVSEAKLFIRLGRESVTLDPTTQVGQNISLAESRETEINSVLEVLQSRAIAQQVVGRLGADMILVEPELPAADEQNLGSRLVHQLRPLLGNDRSLTRDEKAVLQLQEHLHVELSKKRSHVLTLWYKARSPEIARKVLRAVVAVYQQEHVRINQVEGSYDFFVDQTELLREQLEAAQQALRQAKDAGQLASVEGQRLGLESELTQIRSALANTQSAVSGARARQQRLAQQLASLPRFLAEAESGFDNPASDEMRAKLFELEILEKELCAKFTDRHPQVRAIRNQLAEARRILTEQPTARTRIAENANPAYREIHMALLHQQAQTRGLVAQHDALRREHQALLAQLKQLNRSEVRIAQLQQDVALLRASYEKAYAALEQSRVSDALERRQMSNVTIVQPPTLQLKPIAPRKIEILLLSLFIAAFGGIGIAFLAEQVACARRASLGYPFDANSALVAEATASDCPETCTSQLCS